MWIEARKLELGEEEEEFQGSDKQRRRRRGRSRSRGRNMEAVKRRRSRHEKEIVSNNGDEERRDRMASVDESGDERRRDSAHISSRVKDPKIRSPSEKTEAGSLETSDGEPGSFFSVLVQWFCCWLAGYLGVAFPWVLLALLLHHRYWLA